MKRMHWTVPGAAAIAVLLLVPTALATHTSPVSRAFFAETEPVQLQFQGTASSGIRIFESGRITVFTRFQDVSPGGLGNVQIYDRGTCSNPRSFIATLGGVTIGGGGEGSRTTALTAGQRTLLRNALAAGRNLVLRVSLGSRVACERFDAVHPDFFEPDPPRVRVPSFEPTLPAVTPDPFPTHPVSAPVPTIAPNSTAGSSAP